MIQLGEASACSVLDSWNVSGAILPRDKGASAWLHGMNIVWHMHVHQCIADIGPAALGFGQVDAKFLSAFQLRTSSSSSILQLAPGFPHLLRPDPSWASTWRETSLGRHVLLPQAACGASGPALEASSAGWSSPRERGCLCIFAACREDRHAVWAGSCSRSGRMPSPTFWNRCLAWLTAFSTS